MAELIDLQTAFMQRKRWGLAAVELETCSLYKLILNFVKGSKEYRLDPFDKELALWVEDVAKMVTKRCESKQLIEEAELLLKEGVWASYKSDSTH